MKKWTFLFLVLFLTGTTRGNEVVPLPDIFDARDIAVDEQQLYITSGPSVYIYSLEDFALKKKFGRIGGGPKEFNLYRKTHLEITALPDYLLLECLGKISFFTKDGEFIKMLKVDFWSRLGDFQPIEDDFVGIRSLGQTENEYIGVIIYDSSLKQKKEIFRITNPFEKPGRPYNPVTINRIPLLYVCDNKIFIDSDNEVIHVLDRDGKEFTVIQLESEKVKFTNKHKNEYIEYYQSHPILKGLYRRNKYLINYPDHFPNIRHYTVADRKIYVVTYNVENGKDECLIYDLNGDLIKRSVLPLQEYDVVRLIPFTIKSGKLYQLIFNEEKEHLELHITEIE